MGGNYLGLVYFYLSTGRCNFLSFHWNFSLGDGHNKCFHLSLFWHFLSVCLTPCLLTLKFPCLLTIDPFLPMLSLDTLSLNPALICLCKIIIPHFHYISKLHEHHASFIQPLHNSHLCNL